MTDLSPDTIAELRSLHDAASWSISPMAEIDFQNALYANASALLSAAEAADRARADAMEEAAKVADDRALQYDARASAGDGRSAEHKILRRNACAARGVASAIRALAKETGQ